MDGKLQHRSDSFFRSLLLAAPDGILVVNHDGVITQANDQCLTMFGYLRDEMIGQKVELLLPDYIKSRHTGLRDGYFKSPHRRPMGIGLDLSGKRKKGEAIPIEISLAPVDLEGEPCVVAVIRDVTELRRLVREVKQNNEQLKRSNEELEHFAYVASHDLQEPLRMVGSYIQLIQRRYGERLDADGQEFIDYAVDGVQRMQALITDLLLYSRLSTKGLAFAPVQCRNVMTQVLANIDAAVSEANAKIVVEPLPQVLGDPVQLTQLFQNLLTNALKFRRPDAPCIVHVDAVREGDHWHFRVQDNGIGLEAQYAEKIFVIFQRLHTREEYDGTGIGLAVCKKVVERHDGQIWVDSRVGEGSTFHFTLAAAEFNP